MTGNLLVLAVFMNADPSLKAKCIANGNVHITCQRANFVENIFVGGQLQNVTVPAVTTASGASDDIEIPIAAASYTRYRLLLKAG